MLSDDMGLGDLPEATPGDSSLPPEKQHALTLVWEEYKFRQAHYWSSFNRFSLAIIAIQIFPYLRPEVVKPLGTMVVVFPSLALLLTIFCTWLLGAEYERLRVVKASYDKLMKSYVKREYIPEGLWQWVFTRRVGTTTTLAFIIGMTLLSIVSAVLLLNFFLQ